MNTNDNIRDYILSLPCAASLILLVQYLAYFYIYKNNQADSFKRSLVFAIGFFIVSSLLAKVQKVNISLKDIKYKKLTTIFLLAFVILNIINAI